MILATLHEPNIDEMLTVYLEFLKDKTMKINYQVEHFKPSDFYCESYSSGANVNRMRQDIRSCGVAVVLVGKRTKTTLNLTLYSNEGHHEDSFGIAHIPSGAEKFKFVHTEQYNYLWGKTDIRDHFRLTKKQGLSELKEYLSLVLAELNLNMDELTVKIRIKDIPELN